MISVASCALVSFKPHRSLQLGLCSAIRPILARGTKRARRIATPAR